MAKQYKTVLFDYDGTLLDTDVMKQYAEIKKRHRRYTKEWVKDQQEYLSHISECGVYEGWPEVWKYLEEHHIQAAIVTSNGHNVMNEAVKCFNLKGVFPKEQKTKSVNRCRTTLSIPVSPAPCRSSTSSKKPPRSLHDERRLCICHTLKQMTVITQKKRSTQVCGPQTCVLRFLFIFAPK